MMKNQKIQKKPSVLTTLDFGTHYFSKPLALFLISVPNREFAPIRGALSTCLSGLINALESS